MNLNSILFINQYPKLDLHGLTREFVYTYVNDFINDNYKLNNKIIVIVHGNGLGILRKEVHECLKADSRVVNYQTYYNNSGCTIAQLDIK